MFSYILCGIDIRGVSRLPRTRLLLNRLLNIALLSAAVFGVSVAVAFGVSLF